MTAIELKKLMKMFDLPTGFSKYEIVMFIVVACVVVGAILRANLG